MKTRSFLMLLSWCAFSVQGALSTQAATISIGDIAVPLGTSQVDVPILISPSVPGEMIGSINLSFSAGEAADAIPILSTGMEFAGSIWPTPFGVNSLVFAQTPAVHNVFSIAAAIDPLQVPASGIVITYTLNTLSLALGEYVLNPNFIHSVTGIGTTADIPLSFFSGLLRIQEAAGVPDAGSGAMMLFAGLGAALLSRAFRKRAA
jgi:hypothetical protein